MQLSTNAFPSINIIGRVGSASTNSCVFFEYPAVVTKIPLLPDGITPRKALTFSIGIEVPGLFRLA